MNERLFIRLPADAREALRWGLLAPGAEAFYDTGMCERDQLARLAEVAAGREVVLILPGTDVLFSAAQVPSKQLRQVQRALPFLLEDQLVGDVEDQHFATGARAEDGTLAVAVVARARMAAWLDGLKQAGIAAQALVPDAALLPGGGLGSPGACALLDGGLALLRLSELELYALESELLPDMLALRLAEQPGAALRVLGASEAQREALSAALPGAVLSFEDCYDPLLFLAGQYGPATLNLLQGDYAPKTDRSGLISAWRPAAILAAVALGVQLLSVGAEAWSLSREKAALRAQVAQVYAQAFPGQTLPEGRDARKLMQSKLAALGGGEGGAFLPMLQKLGEGFAQSSGVKPLSLSFEAARNELRLDVSAPDFDSLERFRQQLSSQGLAVESGPASDSGNGFQGRLVIRSAP
ncbi:MAG: type II secretion system protein GspL [Gammaproteobacteria bacterium]|nr:type II secretion system protein GspL [Gammaproteobacteria bacterium]